MKFKVYILLLLLGIGILFFLVLTVNYIKGNVNSSQRVIDEYFSAMDEPAPRIPRTVDIPIEIRQEFATVPSRPELITELSHGNHLKKVAFSPTNPDLIVSMNSYSKTEKNIKLWNINNSAHPIAEFSGDSVSFSPDGKILAISSWRNIEDSVKLWAISQKKFISSIRAPGYDVTFSPNGKHLSVETSGLEFWDVSNPAKPIEAFKLESENMQNDHTFSVDGKLLATIESRYENVNVWEINDNQAIKKNSIDVIDENFDRIEVMEFLPNPKNPIFAIANDDYGIKLYHPPEWQNYTVISAKNVNDLTFTADGSTIISGGINEIEFWHVNDGSRFASIEGFSSWTNCVDVSEDSRYVAGGDNDGIIRVWDITHFLPTRQSQNQNVVVPIYFLPTNRIPQTDVKEKIDSLLREVRTYFADEMERNGYGRKSFEYEKDEDGTAKVYLLEGISDDEYYREYTDSRVMNEIEQYFDTQNNIFFVVTDISNTNKSFLELLNSDDSEKVFSKMSKVVDALEVRVKRKKMESRNIVFRKQGGVITIRDSAKDYSIDANVAKFARLFGLTLDYKHPSNLMSYEKQSQRLSISSAEWLNKSQYFNIVETYFDEKTKIKKLSPSIGKARFQVEDADGISQVRLLVSPTEKYIPEYKKQKDHSKNKSDKKNEFCGTSYGLHDVLTLKSKKKTTVEFNYPFHVDRMIELHIIDELGNRVYGYFDIKGNPITSLLRNILN